MKTPLIFIGHGSPQNAIEDNEFSRSWIEVGKSFATPTAILCISAHWQTDGVEINNSLFPETIYDFYGFPDELYQIKYPSPGSPQLAKHILELLPKSQLTQSWGLDHGAWSVLSRLFPKADVPVIQLSLDYILSPTSHVSIAKKLSSLRQEGVLILGSGNMVHNLSLIDWDDIAFPWATDFDNTLKDLIEKRDINSLLNYHRLPDSHLAIPTNEHYLPLLYIMALLDQSDKISFFSEKVVMGSISMRSLIAQ